MTAQLGPVDILVNNVGPYVDTPFLDLLLADFDQAMAGNVRATFLLSQLVGRAMRARSTGRIANLAATDYRHRLPPPTTATGATASTDGPRVVWPA